jgi:hypothetical protein
VRVFCFLKLTVNKGLQQSIWFLQLLSVAW